MTKIKFSPINVNCFDIFNKETGKWIAPVHVFRIKTSPDGHVPSHYKFKTCINGTPIQAFGRRELKEKILKVLNN